MCLDKKESNCCKMPWKLLWYIKNWPKREILNFLRNNFSPSRQDLIKWKSASNFRTLPAFVKIMQSFVLMQNTFKKDWIWAGKTCGTFFPKKNFLANIGSSHNFLDKALWAPRDPHFSTPTFSFVFCKAKNGVSKPSSGYATATIYQWVIVMNRLVLLTSCMCYNLDVVQKLLELKLTNLEYLYNALILQTFVANKKKEFLRKLFPWWTQV